MTAQPEAIAAVIETETWQHHLGEAACEALVQAVWSAFEDEHGPAPQPVAVLFADDARLTALNAQFRGQNKATNVLSFPDGEGGGDIALAFERVHVEARVAGRSLYARTAHMLVHGLAHLAGMSHDEEAEAEAMEAFEARILARLTIADPYAEEAPVDPLSGAAA